MSDDKITVSFNNSTVKVKQQSRGRMKIVVKLSKEEAEGFLNFKKAVLPEGANEDQFLKTIFFMGLDQFHKNAISMMKQYVEDNEDKLREDGVDIEAIKQVTGEIATEQQPTESE